ncbi:MAG: YegP family protein [Clostridia bacterium]|nr:YegP family protein [Clostridia bacterium]
MAGKFIITTAKNGEFTFNLKAGNGEVILTASETYTTLKACENGIASVKKNALAPVEDQTREESVGHPKYELYQDKAGEFRFRLKASNGQNIGKSEGYKAKASAKKGILSIGKNAPDAPVTVVDPE